METVKHALRTKLTWSGAVKEDDVLASELEERWDCCDGKRMDGAEFVEELSCFFPEVPIPELQELFMTLVGSGGGSAVTWTDFCVFCHNQGVSGAPKPAVPVPAKPAAAKAAATPAPSSASSAAVPAANPTPQALRPLGQTEPAAPVAAKLAAKPASVVPSGSSVVPAGSRVAPVLTFTSLPPPRPPPHGQPVEATIAQTVRPAPLKNEDGPRAPAISQAELGTAVPDAVPLLSSTTELPLLANRSSFSSSIDLEARTAPPASCAASMLGAVPSLLSIALPAPRAAPKKLSAPRGEFAPQVECHVCRICLMSGEPPPIASGCTCKTHLGLAHVLCRADAAEQHSDVIAWSKCTECGYPYSGRMRDALAVERWRRVEGRPPESAARLQAAAMLADSLVCQGKYGQAEGLYAEVLTNLRRSCNSSEEEAMATTKSLANCLVHQGKVAEAETLGRELLAAVIRLYGVDGAKPLLAAQSLAGMLSRQGKHSEAEEVLWESLMPVSQVFEGSIASIALARRVRLRDRLRRGRPDASVISVAADLARSLSAQQKHADAEALEREILTSIQRLHGVHHEAALDTSYRLAVVLVQQGKHAEAEALLRNAIPAMKRVLGEHHPLSLDAVNALAGCFLFQGKHSQAEALQQELLAAQLRVMTEPNLAFNAA